MLPGNTIITTDTSLAAIKQNVRDVEKIKYQINVRKCMEKIEKLIDDIGEIGFMEEYKSAQESSYRNALEIIKEELLESK